LKDNKGVLSGKPLKKWRVIIGILAIILAVSGVIYIWTNYEELTKTTITYPDGCVEIYKQQEFFKEPVLVTDECTIGREMVEQGDFYGNPLSVIRKKDWSLRVE
jgi:hypothetical protein